MRTALAASLILAAGLLTLPSVANAAAMRCGNHIIEGGGRHGPTRYEILKKCGKPGTQRSQLWIYKISNTTWELRFNGNGILDTVRQVR